MSKFESNPEAQHEGEIRPEQYDSLYERGLSIVQETEPNIDLHYNSQYIINGYLNLAVVESAANRNPKPYFVKAQQVEAEDGRFKEFYNRRNNIFAIARVMCETGQIKESISYVDSFFPYKKRGGKDEYRGDEKYYNFLKDVAVVKAKSGDIEGAVEFVIENLLAGKISDAPIFETIKDLNQEFRYPTYEEEREPGEEIIVRPEAIEAFCEIIKIKHASGGDTESLLHRLEFLTSRVPRFGLVRYDVEAYLRLAETKINLGLNAEHEIKKVQDLCDDGTFFNDYGYRYKTASLFARLGDKINALAAISTIQKDESWWDEKPAQFYLDLALLEQREGEDPSSALQTAREKAKNIHPQINKEVWIEIDDQGTIMLLKIMKIEQGLGFLPSPAEISEVLKRIDHIHTNDKLRGNLLGITFSEMFRFGENYHEELSRIRKAVAKGGATLMAGFISGCKELLATNKEVAADIFELLPKVLLPFGRGSGLDVTRPLSELLIAAAEVGIDFPNVREIGKMAIARVEDPYYREAPSAEFNAAQFYVGTLMMKGAVEVGKEK